ncbi:hypothetical protein Tco_0498554, partial [Tanacetum coccineum]
MWDHNRLQKELRSEKKKQFLRRFSDIENDVEKANKEIEVEQRSLLKTISELDGYDNKFRRRKMADKKNKFDSSKRYENSSLNKLAKMEGEYNEKQDGS